MVLNKFWNWFRSYFGSCHTLALSLSKLCHGRFLLWRCEQNHKASVKDVDDEGNHFDSKLKWFGQLFSKDLQNRTQSISVLFLLKSSENGVPISFDSVWEVLGKCKWFGLVVFYFKVLCCHSSDKQTRDYVCLISKKNYSHRIFLLDRCNQNFWWVFSGILLSPACTCVTIQTNF